MKKSIPFLLLVFVLIHPGCINKDDSGKTIAKDSIQMHQSHGFFEIEKVIFAGMLGRRTGLYLYDAVKKSYSEFWRNDDQDVVEISYSPSKKSAFMLTAKQTGKRGVFPFIDDVKLYLIYPDSIFVQHIGNIGGGLQVFSSWASDSIFQVYLHVMDAKTAAVVEQKTWSYDPRGKVLSETTKKYYLDKDAFPQFPPVAIKLQSPDKNFSIFSIDSVQTKIFLIDHSQNDDRVLITEESQKLNNVSWSSDGQFLIFSTIDITPLNETLYDEEPQTSKLFIYSLHNKKIIKLFDGGGVKNYLINNDLLMFDVGFDLNSRIWIYDFKSSTMIDSIKMTGGCGMQNIPQIPNYEA
jgi:hypothetical protein